MFDLVQVMSLQVACVSVVQQSKTECLHYGHDQVLSIVIEPVLDIANAQHILTCEHLVHRPVPQHIQALACHYLQITV